MGALRRHRLPHRHARVDAVAAPTSSGPASCLRSLPPCSTSSRRGGDQGRRHGRWRGHTAASSDLEPAQADGADRRKAVHGAHRRAAQTPRLRGRDRHRRLPAPGDPELLRQRRVARHRHRLLGRGVAARHRRLGEARRREARRHVPRHLRRRAVRRRPDGARRSAPREERLRDDRPQVGGKPPSSSGSS